MRRGSNPPPPAGYKRPAPPPPPPPPPRQVGFFGETRDSIRARQDYEVMMKGYHLGFDAAKTIFGGRN